MQKSIIVVVFFSLTLAIIGCGGQKTKYVYLDPNAKEDPNVWSSYTTLVVKQNGYSFPRILRASDTAVQLMEFRLEAPGGLARVSEITIQVTPSDALGHFSLFEGSTAWGVEKSRDGDYVTFSTNQERIYYSVSLRLTADVSSRYYIPTGNDCVVRFVSAKAYDYDNIPVRVDFTGSEVVPIGGNTRMYKRQGDVLFYGDKYGVLTSNTDISVAQPGQSTGTWSLGDGDIYAKMSGDRYTISNRSTGYYHYEPELYFFYSAARPSLNGLTVFPPMGFDELIADATFKVAQMGSYGDLQLKSGEMLTRLNLKKYAISFSTSGVADYSVNRGYAVWLLSKVNPGNNGLYFVDTDLYYGDIATTANRVINGITLDPTDQLLVLNQGGETTLVDDGTASSTYIPIRKGDILLYQSIGGQSKFRVAQKNVFAQNSLAGLVSGMQSGDRFTVLSRNSAVNFPQRFHECSPILMYDSSTPGGGPQTAGPDQPVMRFQSDLSNSYASQFTLKTLRVSGYNSGWTKLLNAGAQVKVFLDGVQVGAGNLTSTNWYVDITINGVIGDSYHSFEIQLDTSGLSAGDYLTVYVQVREWYYTGVSQSNAVFPTSTNPETLNDYGIAYGNDLSY